MTTDLAKLWLQTSTFSWGGEWGAEVGVLAPVDSRRQVRSLTQFYSVDFSQSMIVKKVISTNSQSVLGGVLGVGTSAPSSAHWLVLVSL